MNRQNGKPDSVDNNLGVGQRQVDVGAEPHLVVHPGDDHGVTQEAEHDHPDVSGDALWQRQVRSKLIR